MRGIIPGSFLLLALGGGRAAAEEPPEPPPVNVEAAVRAALNAAGPSIDACVERHLVEYPAADGKAILDLTVDKSGVVQKCVVAAPLEGARNLRVCLEKAGLGVKFPSPGPAGATMKVSAVVKKDAKFRIPDPDEKPAPGEAPKKDEGFVQFLPTTWVPQQ